VLKVLPESYLALSKAELIQLRARSVAVVRGEPRPGPWSACPPDHDAPGQGEPDDLGTQNSRPFTPIFVRPDRVAHLSVGRIIMMLVSVCGRAVMPAQCNQLPGKPSSLGPGFVCVFITAGSSTKLVAWGGGGYWRTCTTRDDEPRPVWTSLPMTH
jgi:hypothetical protein